MILKMLQPPERNIYFQPTLKGLSSSKKDLQDMLNTYHQVINRFQVRNSSVCHVLGLGTGFVN
jgi:hypothetical protein